MNEQYEENEFIEEEFEIVEENKEVKEYHFSWRKMLGWFSIILALTSPLISIGISLVCINTAPEDEKKEVSIICYVGFGIALFFILFDLVTRNI